MTATSTAPADATSTGGPPTKRPGHVPALDGYRGLGLIGMLCYHAGAHWAQGAIFTISTFFTLSGFLITTLLINERSTKGLVDIKQFWIRRFRRLLPAAVVVLGFIVLFGVTFADETQRASLRGDLFAALGYVANWRFVFSGTAYLNSVSTPSPVLHFWSLAIEEQFYLVFPLIVIALVGRRKRHASRGVDDHTFRLRLGIGLAALTAMSIAIPFVVSMSQDRVYLGTDTRAAEILMGCLLAVLMSGHRLGDPMPDGPIRRTLTVIGPIALVGGVFLWVSTPKTAAWIYEGGFAMYSVLSCVLVAASLDARNPVGIVFSRKVLVWLGQRSYGIYLIHFPLFMVINSSRTGLSFWPLLAVRVACSVGLAALSYTYLEEPLRRGRPVLGQPLWKLAPAFMVIVVVAAVLTTTNVSTGTLQTVSANPDALRIGSTGAVDQTPVVPADGAAQGATAVVTPTTTEVPSVETTTSLAPPGGLIPKPIRKPARKLRMLIVGDSSALFLGFALDGWNGTHKIFDIADYGLMGCGLVTGGTEVAGGVERGFDPSCAQWKTKWAAALVESKPDLIVMAGSFHDVTDRRLTADGPLEHIGEPAYDARLLATYRELVDLMSSPGVPILWLDNPPVREGQNHPDQDVNTPANDPQRMIQANQLVAKVAAERPLVHVVPYASFFLTWPGGPLDPKLRQDGLHVDYDGRAIVSGWLGPELLDAYWQAVGR